MNTLLKLMSEIGSRLTEPAPTGALPGERQSISAGKAFRTIIAVDYSGSMDARDYAPSRYLAAVDAGKEYIKERLKASPEDLFGVVLFNHDSYVVSSCIDINKYQKIIATMKRIAPTGGTEIKAGLVAAAQMLPVENSHYQNRIVLLSDGHGGRPYRTADRIKNQRKVIIDCIGVAGNRRHVDERGLKRIASEDDNGRPRYRFIKDRKQLIEHFKKIATDLVIVR